MRKIKYISIVTLICILTVFLCACKTKRNEKDSVGTDQTGSKTESEEKNDTELEVDESEKIPSSSYSELFEEEESADKNKVESNSGDKEDKQEVTTPNPGEGDKKPVQDDTSTEPDNEGIETVTDTETQYGAISGGNP